VFLFCFLNTIPLYLGVGWLKEHKKRKMHYVYFYRDPRPGKNNTLVYVGKGTGKRAYDHWENPSRSRNSRLKNLLALLRRNGLEPIIEIVFEFETEAEALAKEIELIAFYGRADLGKGPLFNNTDGGEGFINIGPDVLIRRSKSIKETYNRPEKKAEQSRRSLSSWSKPEFREARIKEMHERSKNPEYIERLTKAIRKSHSRQEIREKIGKASKERWKSDEYRAKHLEGQRKAFADPKQKERRGSATKAGWQNEETRRKRTEGIQAAQTPEMIARRAEANRDGWTEEKRAAFSKQMKEQCADPEHLKRRSEAAKAAWAKRKAAK